MVFVVDASVMVKLVLDETASHEVRAWYQSKAAERKLAPHILWSEVGRALQKNRGGFTTKQLATQHEDVVATVEFCSVPAAAVWVCADDLTFHDAQYVALAKDEKATLVSCDKDMVKAARKAGIDVVAF